MEIALRDAGTDFVVNVSIALFIVAYCVGSSCDIKPR